MKPVGGAGQGAGGRVNAPSVTVHCPDPPPPKERRAPPAHQRGRCSALPPLKRDLRWAC